MLINAAPTTSRAAENIELVAISKMICIGYVTVMQNLFFTDQIDQLW